MNQETEKPSASDYAGLVRLISWTPLIAGAVLLTLVVAYVVAFYQNGWAKDPDAWGQLGDYIGGLLNPLVAGFALLALVASVLCKKRNWQKHGRPCKSKQKLPNSSAASSDFLIS